MPTLPGAVSLPAQASAPLTRGPRQPLGHGVMPRVAAPANPVQLPAGCPGVDQRDAGSGVRCTRFAHPAVCCSASIAAASRLIAEIEMRVLKPAEAGCMLEGLVLSSSATQLHGKAFDALLLT